MPCLLWVSKGVSTPVPNLDDNLLVVGRYKGVETMKEDDEIGDVIVIEVYVYNKGEGSFYIHHHMELEAFPIALEWLDFHPSDQQKGSFLAVGDTTGKIGVWNLDVTNQEFPDYTLEREDIDEGEEIEVNCLGWNKNLRNILASGYSDGLIVLWDIQTRLEKKVLTAHKRSVQTLQWDPFETRYLLSGCTKGYVKLYDHQSDGDKPIKTWKIKAEIEKVCWNKAQPSKFFCATHKGFVYSVDVHAGLQYRMKVHKDCVTALDMSPDYPNLLLTTSFDQFVKVWDLNHVGEESNPFLKPIFKRKPKIDKIFTGKFAPDSALVVAVGGDSKDNNLKILDLKHLNTGKKKLKSLSVEEENGKSTPANKKHKKNVAEASNLNGNSIH